MITLSMLESEIFEKYQYKDAIDSASAFNTRLLVERQSRLPFLDTQTNIAQVDCHIWKKKCERVEPVGKGVEYAYQVRYWKKLPKPKKKETPPPELPVNPDEVPTVEEMPLSVKPELIADEGTGLDTPPSAPTPEEQSPSSDDYEMYYERKRKRQSRGTTSRRSKGGPVENVRRGSRSRKGSVISTRSSRSAKDVEMEAVEIPPQTEIKEEIVVEGVEKKAGNVCDFCLTENNESKESKAGEITISCVDCSRTAHPSCLQFEGSLAENVKSYNWQCIECKSCSICGTSDNDDQLLFCDECDRGFHMYCLTPRIERPPEGRWVCHMCNKQPATPANVPLQAAKTPVQNANMPLQTANMPVQTASMPLQTANMSLQAANIPLQTANMPLQAANMPLQTASMPLQTASMPLQTANMPLQTANLLPQAAAIAPEVVTMPLEPIVGDAPQS